jgi:hypothetical protein
MPSCSVFGTAEIRTDVLRMIVPLPNRGQYQRLKGPQQQNRPGIRETEGKRDQGIRRKTAGTRVDPMPAVVMT